MITKLISGGQTGADRGGLDAAIHCEWPHGGWCPKGRKAEDGIIPADYQLNEMASSEYLLRTQANVIDSDATIIFTYGPPTGGSLKTSTYAHHLEKPYHEVDLPRTTPKTVIEIMRWLAGDEEMSITLKAMTGDGSKWLMIFLLPFLFAAYGCGQIIPGIMELGERTLVDHIYAVVKRGIEVPENIQGKSIYIVQNENPRNPVLEHYVVGKFKKAFQALGALIVANPSEADFLLHPDLGPNHDAEIPESERPRSGKITFTRRVEIHFYKQRQNSVPVASGKIYSTGSGDDLGWNVTQLSEILKRGFGFKEIKELKN